MAKITLNVNVNRRRIATRDADWKEDDHKRDHGKFSKMAGAKGAAHGGKGISHQAGAKAEAVLKAKPVQHPEGAKEIAAHTLEQGMHMQHPKTGEFHKVVGFKSDYSARTPTKQIQLENGETINHPLNKGLVVKPATEAFSPFGTPTRRPLGHNAGPSAKQPLKAFEMAKAAGAASRPKSVEEMAKQGLPAASASAGAPTPNTGNVATALRPDAGKYKHPADQKWMANRLAEVDAALKSPNPVEALSKIRENPSYSRFTAYKKALLAHHGGQGGGGAAVGSPEHAKQQSEAAYELARGQRSPVAAGPSAEPAKPYDFGQIANAWHNTHGSPSTPREHMEGEAKQHIDATVARVPKAAEAFGAAMQSSEHPAEQRKAVMAAMRKLADDTSVPYGPTNNLYKALMTHFKESGASSPTQTRGERISKYLGQKFIGPRGR